ncbi:polymerase delta-interacting protein 2 [Plecturocebus cupreus]
MGGRNWPCPGGAHIRKICAWRGHWEGRARPGEADFRAIWAYRGYQEWPRQPLVVPVTDWGPVAEVALCSSWNWGLLASGDHDDLEAPLIPKPTRGQSVRDSRYKSTLLGLGDVKGLAREESIWLELSNVHQETTENIRVTVIPFYTGMREAQNSHVYWWCYCIHLENLDSDVVQLREQHWRIFSLSCTLETVQGQGVVGRELVSSKEQPAFLYSSHVSLQASSGHMWGTFHFKRPDGSHFDVWIPPFSLESNKAGKIPPLGLH